MKDEFVVYRKFSTRQQALAMEDLLHAHGVPAKVGDNAPPVDVTFSGNTANIETEIRLHPEDFEKANAILEESVREQVNRVERDHYLFDFSNEELYEILLKPDEWNEADYLLSQRILRERGEKVDPEFLVFIRKERLNQLSQPEKGSRSWIMAGYLLALLGGFFAIFLGYFMLTAKKTLPDGRRIHAWSVGDRWHGRLILLLGLICFPLWMLWYFQNY